MRLYCTAAPTPRSIPLSLIFDDLADVRPDVMDGVPHPELQSLQDAVQHDGLTCGPLLVVPRPERGWAPATPGAAAIVSCVRAVARLAGRERVGRSTRLPGWQAPLAARVPPR